MQAVEQIVDVLDGKCRMVSSLMDVDVGFPLESDADFEKGVMPFKNRRYEKKRFFDS